MSLDAHPENAKPATDEIGRLRDQVITQAFVAGQMDAQYTAAVQRHLGQDDVTARTALKLLKAKAYALALDSIDALLILVRQEAEHRCDPGAGFHAWYEGDSTCQCGDGPRTRLKQETG